MRLSTLGSYLGIDKKFEDIELQKFSIDTRTIAANDVFVALKGQILDGHDFIADAVAKGAKAVICSRKLPGIAVMQFVVVDPGASLVDIATKHRKKMPAKIIALTGSNGKTSVKEMITRILPQPSLATIGNYNNIIGVPLSVLALKEEHKFAVFELGANQAGDIEKTVKIVKPDVSLINNIGPAHLQGFGSLEGVVAEKSHIYLGLAKDGIAIENYDEKFRASWQNTIRERLQITYSLTNKNASIYAKNLTYSPESCGSYTLCTAKSSITIKLAVPGEHNVANSLAAAACCYALGIGLENIAQGLADYSGTRGRLTLIQGRNNSQIIDDTYNANLASTLVALKILAQAPGEKIFVFGDMGELGDNCAQHHAEVGRYADQLGIDRLYTVGKYSINTNKNFSRQRSHHQDHASLYKLLKADVSPSSYILVKGSRSAGMEQIVELLTDFRD